MSIKSKPILRALHKAINESIGESLKDYTKLPVITVHLENYIFDAYLKEIGDSIEYRKANNSVGGKTNIGIRYIVIRNTISLPVQNEFYKYLFKSLLNL